MTAEVPVWISGTQKWVTGVTRKTTCEDVVRALLKAEEVRLQQNPGAVPDPLLFSPPSSSLTPSSSAAAAAAASPTAPFVAVDARHFAVVERWRKMERPLDSGSRILKAWNAWGDQKYEIKFSLKRVEPLTPRTVKTSSHRHRRPSHAGGGGGASGSRRHWRHAGSPPRSEEHPRKFSKSAEQNIETLMKMILAQGETIRAQLGRLKDREDDIAYLETRFSDDDDGDGDRRKPASAILSKGSPNNNKISVAPGPTGKTGVNSNSNSSSNNNNNNGEEAGSNDSGIVEDSTLIAKNKKLQRRASVASRHEIVRVDVHEAPAGRTMRGSSADRDRDDGFVDSTIRSSNLAAIGKNKLMTASSSALFSRGDVPSSSSSSSAASSPTTAGNANNKSSSSSYRSTRGSDPNLPSRDVEPGRDRRFRPTTERDVQQPPPPPSSSSGNNRAIRSHSLYCPQQSRQLPQAKPEAPTTRRLPTLPGQQQQQDRDVRRLPRPTAGVNRDDDDDDDDYQQQQQQQQAAGVQQHPSPAKNRAERLRNAARSRAATTSQRILDGDGDGGAAACPGELPQTRPISSMTTTTDAEIDNCVRIYEQVLDLCLRLEEEEERINRLTAKIQRENARQSGSSSGGDEDDADDDDYADGGGDGGRRHHDAERLLAESERELRHMRRLSDNLNSEIERNDRTMADMSLVLRDKQVYLDQLQFQLMQAERDSDYLQDALDNFVLASPQPSPSSSSSSSSSSSKPTLEAGAPGCRPPPPPSAPKGILKNKTNAAPAAQVITTTPGRQRHASHQQQQQGRTLAGGKDGVASTGPVNGAGPQRDADSDTGLSSLHSSSDEAQYALDTLV